MLENYTLGTDDPDALKNFVEQSLDADKAEDIISIQLEEGTALADYMVIASGNSSRQVGALAQKLAERLKGLGHTFVKIEGLEDCNWVIVDAGDIIVHIFRPEVREFYNIEKMWQSTTPHQANSASDQRPTL